MTRICPTCQREWPEPHGELTPREFDMLDAWWKTRSVKRAAAQVGVGQQRAKNIMARARLRAGVKTNDELLGMYIVRLAERSASHNQSGSEAA